MRPRERAPDRTEVLGSRRADIACLLGHGLRDRGCRPRRGGLQPRSLGLRGLLQRRLDLLATLPQALPQPAPLLPDALALRAFLRRVLLVRLRTLRRTRRGRTVLSLGRRDLRLVLRRLGPRQLVRVHQLRPSRRRRHLDTGAHRSGGTPPRRRPPQRLLRGLPKKGVPPLRLRAPPPRTPN